MVKGVIFDMDGTMLDTERLSTTVWRLAGEDWNVEISKELIDSCRGKSPDMIRQIFKERFGPNFDYDGIRNRKHEFFNEIVDRDGVPIKKGLFELLDFLKVKEIPMAVATSTEKLRGEQILKKAGIYDYFTGYVYGDTVAASKPDPDIFWKAAEEIGQDPKDCLVVEDTTPGVMAGKAAGGYIIHIPDVVKVPDEVKEGITAEMKDLSEIIGWICKENHL